MGRIHAPRVSVLLPVRDAAETVAEAVSSVLGQTLRDLELIVVDDGSVDDSGDIVRRLAAADPRVRLEQTLHRGLVPALRTAVDLSRAPYLARMDADDRSHPHRLERQLTWLQRRPELGAVGCLVRSIPADDVGEIPEGWQRYQRWLNGRRTWRDITRDLLVESPLAHPSVMLRRQAYDAVGGYRDFDGPEDYDLWLRLARDGWQLAKVPAVLLDWRDRPDRLTRTDPRYRPEAFLALKAQHLVLGPLAAIDQDRPVWIWGAGRYGKQLCRALEREGCHQVTAFIDIDPGKIGGERRGRPVLDRSALRQQPKPAVLTAVSVPGARRLIRRQLTTLGYVEGSDYWCCA